MRVKYHVSINFNPHSRKGSDRDVPAAVSDKDKISIHTPARGVTVSCCKNSQPEYISIHTPARGVTNDRAICPGCGKISIHTPARGVTEVSVDYLIGHTISIHTPARGVTCTAGLPLRHVRVFQSTLPQGE